MNEIGRLGEQVARRWLEQRGYAIKAMNYRVGRKEIDIIAQKEDGLHFVEVKTRKAPAYVEPELAVTPAKQLRILSAARAYINRYGLDMEAQCDVIVVILFPEGPQVHLIERAFYPQNRK